MYDVIRIAEVIFPPDVEEKLWARHKLTIWEVQQVVHDPSSEGPRWDDDPIHGQRAVIRGRTRGANARLMYVALRPVDWDKGIWACVTAFVPEDEEYGAE